MFDKIYNRNAADTEVLYRPDYNPAHVVTASRLLNPDGQYLVAMFPPWHGGGRAYELLAKRLVNRDKAVFWLEFDDQILTHDADQVLQSFSQVQSQVANTLHGLADSGRYDRISLFAASLGTPSLAMTASVFNQFESAVMITPGSNLARCMWHGVRTRRVRQELEARGETLSHIDELWQPIAPVNHMEALRGKDVSVIVSDADKMIPTRYQNEYVEALVADGVSPSVYRSKCDHYGTIGRYCMLGDINSI